MSIDNRNYSIKADFPVDTIDHEQANGKYLNYYKNNHDTDPVRDPYNINGTYKFNGGNIHAAYRGTGTFLIGGETHLGGWDLQADFISPTGEPKWIIRYPNDDIFEATASQVTSMSRYGTIIPSP